MEHLNDIFAANLKRIREDKKLSLDKVATMTGVSKSMLGQIERGESNPTITTVWKIAAGLKVSFTSLINEPVSDHKIVAKEDVEPMVEDRGKIRFYPLFPYRDDQPFEVYMCEMDKGAYMEGNSHGEGSHEVITVYEGEVTMRVEDQELVVKKGSGMQVRADRPHNYHNTYDGVTQMNIVIYYPQN